MSRRVSLKRPSSRGATQQRWPRALTRLATRSEVRPVMRSGPRPRSVAFAMRDGALQGCAFTIDARSEPLVFGTAGSPVLVGESVLPVQLVVMAHQGRLIAASADADRPAIANGRPLPATWTVLEVPSRVRVGDAAIDFFFADEKGIILLDEDVSTRVSRLSLFAATAPASECLPRPVTQCAAIVAPAPAAQPAPLPQLWNHSAQRVATYPPARAFHARSELQARPRLAPSWNAMSGLELAAAASRVARALGGRASTSALVAITMTAVLFAFLLGRVVHDGGPAPLGRAAAPPTTPVNLAAR